MPLFFEKSVAVTTYYTLAEAWSGVNWPDLMAAQGAFWTDFCDKSTRTIEGTMLWTLIKIGSKGALGCHEIRPIHSAPSLGQSIPREYFPQHWPGCCGKGQLLSLR